MRDNFSPAKSSHMTAPRNSLHISTDAKMACYPASVTTLPALLLAASGIGFGHAVLPDHWMPLAVLSRARRYPTRQVVRVSLAAAAAHVLVSLLLGGVLVLVGLRFRDTVAHH